jgi:RNA recognition motif-containing protein
VAVLAVTGVFGCVPSSGRSSRSSFSLPQRLAARATLVSECLQMTKIYVGNLPFSADETSVRQLFEQHGKVESVALINDRETGRPRGFGFVEMPSSDAARAIQSLNGQNMGGRPLRVNEAQERTGGGGGGNRGGGGPRRW